MADEVNEWDLLPKSPEGRPRITVNPLPKREVQSDSEPGHGGTEQLPVSSPYDAATDYDPWQRAAQRLRDSNVGKEPTPDFDWTSIPRSANQNAINALKSWYETTEGRYYPPNAAYVDDSGQFRDENNEPIPDEKKPVIAPVARNPVTGAAEPAIPGIFDVWNTVGSPVKGVASLGAGIVRRAAPGIGHNSIPGGVPPPPRVAPPPMAGPGRQIIRGMDESKPFSWDDLYTQTMDDLHPLKVLQNKMAEHGAIAPQEQFYELARLTRGAYGRTQQALDNGTFDFHTLKNTGMGLKQALKPVRNSLDRFEDYAVAVRDIELLDRGINPGTTRAEAMGHIAAAPPEFRTALKNLHGYQDRVLQYLGDSGLLSPDALKNIRAANRSYVPFHRMMESSEGAGSSKNIKTWDPIRTIKGSNRNILSPLETIVRNTHAFIDLAEKNRTLNALVDAAESRGLTGLVEKVPREFHPVQVQMKEIEKFLQDNGIPVPPGLSNAPDSFGIFRPNALRPASDEIKVWKNGKPSLYKVDPEIANTVNGMGRQEIDTVMKFVSAPARWLRAGAVLSPEFLGRNLVRDQMAAAIMSKNNYVPFIDYLRGVGHMVAKSEGYQNWLKSGGANSNLVTLERSYVRDQIQNMKETGWFDKIKNNLNPLKFLEKASEYSEQPTRIAEFIKASNKGKSVHDAGFEAREVTVDFGRRGASKAMQTYTHMTAFANPTLQGTDRFARAVLENPTGTMFKVGAYVVTPTLMAYAYNRQDPRMHDIPRQERDTFWHFPTDDWRPISKDDFAKLQKSGAIPSIKDYKNWIKTVDGQMYVNQGQIYKIPKPFEMGVMFGSSIERSLDAYFEKDPHAFKSFAKSVMSAFLPSFIPTPALPAIEAYTNYKFFTEAPLVSKRVSTPKARQYEYTYNTTESAKIVGNVVAQMAPESQFASPIVLENYVNGWGGTLGRYSLQIIDAALEGGKRAGAALSGSERKPKVSPAWSEADIPVWRAFVSRMPSTAAQPIRDFYENLESSTTTQALMKRMAKSTEFENDVEKRLTTNDIRANNPAIKMAKIGVAVNRMFRAIENINNSRDMDAKFKRQAIDILTINMIYATTEANKIFDQTQKAQKGPPQ